MSFNIAIDGPAGAGKSTIAKLAAKELGFIYVDTGAMYRTIALGLLRMLLNGENVTGLIRTEEVSRMASISSAKPAVREKLLLMQRSLAASRDVIMDGRDIGTRILPQAQLKIYLTASTRARAERRYLELRQKGEACSLEEIEKDMKERDYRDMHRETAPLKQARDAVLVDTSHMTIQEVVERIVALARERQ